MAIEPEGYLHRARFVVPATDSGPEVIENGGVLTRHGRIVAVGPASDFPDPQVPVIDHGDAVLMPPLVNCHCHLELSYLCQLAESGSWERPGEMAAWIETLVNAREKDTTDAEEQRFVAWQALAGLYARGCLAVADVGNDPESADIGREFKIRVQFFREVLGMTTGLAPRARELADAARPEEKLTPHSVYGTAPDIIGKLKSRGGDNLFPIHLAESLEELEFLATGSGPLADFLNSRGGIDPAFTPVDCGPVSYLDGLGALDENTLCVHCVHLSEDEISLIGQRHAGVCLCPGSNRYLGVGIPPVSEMLAAGIKPGIGTDSLVSNGRLDLWEEMKLLAAMDTALDPAIIVKMATSWGSDILGLSAELGRLKPGALSSFLAVRGDVPQGPDDVFAFLVNTGSEIDLEWVE